MTSKLCPAPYLAFRDKRPLIVLKDRKSGPSQFVAHNPKQRVVEVLRIDDGCCWSGSACDFLLLVDDSDAYLIELKGLDVEKAIKQINITLDALEKKLLPRTIHVRIVPTRVRVPGLVRTDQIRLERRLGHRKRYRCQGQKLEKSLP